MAAMVSGVDGSGSHHRNGDRLPGNELGARLLVLGGSVQGLGVRPAIFRLAKNLSLAGSVRNTSRGVEIELEGQLSKLDEFQQHLLKALPAAARLQQVKSEPLLPSGRKSFAIVTEPANGPLTTRVPQDRALCTECLAEVNRANDRRQGYPLTSCTLCGPRYSVVRRMPFERNDTSMDKFPLCSECAQEYTHARDRRFHAQTMACPSCGPRMSFKASPGSEELAGAPALEAAVSQLRAGRIVAIKGLGGYQLLVDAKNEAAVERLRERKGRRAKPLAVMVASLEAAQKLAHLDATEKSVFQDATGPIVLVQARAKNGLAAAINPHLNTIGLMRPTTPLHAILAQNFDRALVCTSANREGDPLEFEASTAEKELSDITDSWLHHNREILRPIDDSVVRVIAGRPVTIRLARGLAPLPLDLPTVPPMIAVGSFLKAAVAWSNGSQCALGPHIGDQQSLASRKRFLAHLKDLLRLYRFSPAALVHDMHPEYFSTQWAQKQPLPQVAVQHHHAHVVAGMLEHGWLDRQVLGVAWDGTGYGTDGTIWGGEFMVCSADRFERVARIRPFALPGGEAAIHEPWRIAVSVCAQLDRAADLARWNGWAIDAKRLSSVTQIANRAQLSPVTSSAGRLIDAAAALILGIDHADYDGQAAMRLEATADRDARGWYHFPASDEELKELDWRPLFTGVLGDCQRGVEPSIIAMRFFRSLAHGIFSVCRHYDELPSVLTGGVFQNKILTELVAEMIEGKSQLLGLPGVIPPNDGGLAAGQLAIAAAKGKL